MCLTVVCLVYGVRMVLGMILVHVALTRRNILSLFRATCTYFRQSSMLLKQNWFWFLVQLIVAGSPRLGELCLASRDSEKQIH